MKFASTLDQHLKFMEGLERLAPLIDSIGQGMVSAIAGHGKILICGNGGSAADAQHFAAELIGRFERERRPWPAIALTTDSSILTAVGNDYGFEDVFARQVQGLGNTGDLLIGISTSGNSPNVLRAAAVARQMGMGTIGLLGGNGGRLAAEVDHAVVIPGRGTARIQEAHILILHFWAASIESALAENH